MSNLQHRQQKIQEKRKQTPWRKFLMEIASRQQLSFSKIKGNISRYPDSNRIQNLVSAMEFDGYMQQGQKEKEYQKDLPFFDQFLHLQQQAYLPYLRQVGDNPNSQYSDTVYQTNNVFLCTNVAFGVSNSLYSFEVSGNSDMVIASNSTRSNCNNIYESVSVRNSSNIFFCAAIDGSNNIWCSWNMIGCTECLFCDNLTNQSYCINNIPYNREEYLIQKQKILSNKQNLKKQQSKDVKTNIMSDEYDNCYFMMNTKTARNVLFSGSHEPQPKSNLYDVFSSGSTIDHAYACMGVSPGDNFYCTINSGNGSNLYYSMFLVGCSFCLGCIGLKNKQFCIFNKQYTKEERYVRAEEIFRRMEEEGTLGDFFPGSMNPFYFNDTAAYLIDNSFTKEEVTTAGYLRRDEPIKVDIPAGVQTVKNTELDQYEGRNVSLGKGDGEGSEPGGSAQRRIDDEILKKVILDEHGNAYRVIPMELEFLRKHGLPLPRKHWLERMKENFRIG